jgi:endonuclease G
MKIKLCITIFLSLIVCAIAKPPTGINSVYAGFPDGNATNDSYEILINAGYVVGYSDSREDHLWAAYHLSTNSPAHHDPRPKEKFATDNRTKAKIPQKAYKPASREYDLGHMAPNHAIDEFFGSKAQQETFKMSNVCPQAACLNEETWAGLESEIADKLTKKYGEVWAIDGPIFGTNSARVEPSGVEIPIAFFYVIVWEDNGQPRMLGVVLDQTVSGKHELGEFVRPIDEIEKETGLNFFPNLPAITKETIYSENAGAYWPLDDTLKTGFTCRLNH